MWLARYRNEDGQSIPLSNHHSDVLKRAGPRVYLRRSGEVANLHPRRTKINALAMLSRAQQQLHGLPVGKPNRGDIEIAYGRSSGTESDSARLQPTRNHLNPPTISSQ